MSQNDINLRLIIDNSASLKSTEQQKKALEEIVQEISKVGKGSKNYDVLKKAQLELSKTIFDGATSLKEKREAYEQLESSLGGIQKGTQLFQEFANVIGSAKDEIDFMTISIDNAANDFANLEAGIQAGELIASSFGLATGAMSLFGIESENAEKTMAKLVSVMTVLNSLSTISNLIRKESVLTERLMNFQRTLSVGLLGKQRVAQITANVATGQATLFQRALNAAMTANPAFILIGVITALTAAYTYFSSQTEEASKQQDELNEKLKEVKQNFATVYDERIKSGEELRKAELKQLEQTEMSKINAIEDEKERLLAFVKFKKDLLIKEKDGQDKRNAEEITSNKNTIDLNERLIKTAEARILGETDIIERKKIENRLQGYKIEVQRLKERNETIKNIELKNKTELETSLKQVDIDAQKELQKLREEFRKKELEKVLSEEERKKSLVFDKIKEFNHEVVQLEQKKNEEIEKIIMKSNLFELKAEEERYIKGKINLEQFLKIREDLMTKNRKNLLPVEQEAVKILEDSYKNEILYLKNINSAKAEISKITGSIVSSTGTQNAILEDNSFLLKENLLFTERIASLGEDPSLLEDRLEVLEKINIVTGKTKDDLIEQGIYSNKLGQTNIQTLETLLDYEIQLLDARKKQDEEKIQSLEKNKLKVEEVLKQEVLFLERENSRKKGILGKALGDDLRSEKENLENKLRLVKFYNEGIIKSLQDRTRAEIQLLDAKTAQELGMEYNKFEIFKLQRAMFGFDLNNYIKNELNAEEEKYDELKKMLGDYDAEYNRILQDNTNALKVAKDKEVSLEKELQEKRTAAIIEGIRLAQQAQAVASEQIGASIDRQYDREIQKIDELEQKRLDAFDREQQLRELSERNASIQEYQQLKRDEQIAEKRKEIEEDAQNLRNQAQLKQFEAQKKLRISEAIMNAATAISLVTAQTGIAAPFSIPVIAAINAAQIGLIAAEQPPIFEKGGIIGGRRHKDGGTVVEAEKDEVIINRKSANMFPGLLSSLNEQGGGVSFATITPKEQTLINQMSTNNIDYDKLANLINDRPIKTYVTESEMTFAQSNVQKQRRRSQF